MKFVKFISLFLLFTTTISYAESLRVEAGEYGFAKNCNIRAHQVKELNGVGKIYEFLATVSGQKPYDENQYFTIDATNTAWVGKVGACADELATTHNETVKYYTEKNGKYVLISARCGKWSTPFESDSIVVLDSTTGKVVYLKSKMKVAKFGLPNGMHSGPIKDISRDFSCKNENFDPSIFPLIKDFDNLGSILDKKGTVAQAIADLYRAARLKKNASKSVDKSTEEAEVSSAE